MKRLFLDTNILIDVLIRKAPASSIDLLKKIEDQAFEGWVSSLSVVNTDYIIRKEFGAKKARSAIQLLMQIIHISTVDERTIRRAFESDFRDFEDGVQYFSALDVSSDNIISRNVKDFGSSKIPVYTPEEFLKVTGEE